MIINSIRDFMRQCPLLEGNRRINVDYLPNNPVEYSIDAIPSNTVVKKYTSGGAIKQFIFVFASKEYYGSDVLTNIENSGFYEDLSNWIETKSKRGELPQLSKGRESISMEVLDSGYLFQADEDMARYQMQLRLTYYED